jgi:BirA family biotin operon repressor/biotin-[acetyl-CoA-carboxylase] ligase
VSITSPKFIILESVDSTNNYAMAMVQKGVATTGDAVFAMEQSSGKGRRGKIWKSKRGQNILLTVLAQMQWLPVQQQFHLSMGIALACHDFFSKYSKENIKIKWPNDIFINDRKAGGILIENVIKGNLWQWAIIGIGLNINQENFEKDKLKAISLKQLTGKDYDVTRLSRELREIVLKRLLVLQSGELPEVLSEYNENLFSRNKWVKLKKGNIVFETKIERVSASGELVTKDVTERSFGFDEIQWMI